MHNTYKGNNEPHVIRAFCITREEIIKRKNELDATNTYDDRKITKERTHSIATLATKAINDNHEKEMSQKHVE